MSSNKSSFSWGRALEDFKGGSRSLGSSSNGSFLLHVSSTPNLRLVRCVSRQMSDDRSRSRKNSPSSYLGKLTKLLGKRITVKIFIFS